MADEKFPCQACGESVANPDRTRFTLSASRPAVCPRCGAPHVYDAGIQIDQGWVRRQMEELAELRRRSRAEPDTPDLSTETADDATLPRSGPEAPAPQSRDARHDARSGARDDRRDGHSFGSQH
jgi:hypothetical protein